MPRAQDAVDAQLPPSSGALAEMGLGFRVICILQQPAGVRLDGFIESIEGMWEYIWGL